MPGPPNYSDSLADWLDLQEAVLQMQAPAVQEELEKMAGAPDTGDELYYFGLLNQQMKEYSHWIAARDAFRQVRKDPELELEQRQLAGILERYNQSLINAQSRQEEWEDKNRLLRRKLDTLDDEKALLEQKIQALTDLEAVISTRKEQ